MQAVFPIAFTWFSGHQKADPIQPRVSSSKGPQERSPLETEGMSMSLGHPGTRQFPSTVRSSLPVREKLNHPICAGGWATGRLTFVSPTVQAHLAGAMLSETQAWLTMEELAI